MIKQIESLGSQNSLERMHSVMQLFKKTMKDSPEQAAMLIEEND